MHRHSSISAEAAVCRQSSGVSILEHPQATFSSSLTEAIGVMKHTLYLAHYLLKEHKHKCPLSAAAPVTVAVVVLMDKTVTIINSSSDIIQTNMFKLGVRLWVSLVHVLGSTHLLSSFFMCPGSCSAPSQQ